MVVVVVVWCDGGVVVVVWFGLVCWQECDKAGTRSTYKTYMHIRISQSRFLHVHSSRLV